jgi:hypothetical protein
MKFTTAFASLFAVSTAVPFPAALADSASSGGPLNSCASEVALDALIFRFGGCDTDDSSGSASFNSVALTSKYDAVSRKWDDDAVPDLPLPSSLSGSVATSVPWRTASGGEEDVIFLLDSQNKEISRYHPDSKAYYHHTALSSQLSSAASVFDDEGRSIIYYGSLDNSTAFYGFYSQSESGQPAEPILIGWETNKVRCLASSVDKKKLFGFIGTTDSETKEDTYELWTADKFKLEDTGYPFDGSIADVSAPFPEEINAYGTQCMVSSDNYFYVFYGPDYYFVDTNTHARDLAWYKGSTTLNPVHGKNGAWLYSAVMISDTIFVTNNGVTTVIQTSVEERAMGKPMKPMKPTKR